MSHLLWSKIGDGTNVFWVNIFKCTAKKASFRQMFQISLTSTCFPRAGTFLRIMTRVCAYWHVFSPNNTCVTCLPLLPYVCPYWHVFVPYRLFPPWHVFTPTGACLPPTDTFLPLLPIIYLCWHVFAFTSAYLQGFSLIA